jgi:hypothetical protein
VEDADDASSVQRTFAGGQARRRAILVTFERDPISPFATIEIAKSACELNFNGLITGNGKIKRARPIVFWDIRQPLASHYEPKRTTRGYGRRRMRPRGASETY